jgi:hypothetical protein
MDFVSSIKNTGSSAGIGSSSSGDGSGMFSNFFNLSIQKMVLVLAMIAFIISVGTVAILLWKSKSAQKWPPEIAKCPDRMTYDLTAGPPGVCKDTYGLGVADYTPVADNCANYNAYKTGITYSSVTSGVSSEDYIPWEGILDGKASKSASLKCL